MPIVHLHHKRDIRFLRELGLGIAICGVKDVPRAQLTAFDEDTNCPQCLERLARMLKEQSATIRKPRVHLDRVQIKLKP